MSECTHDLAERATMAADGYCPFCLLADIYELQAKVDNLLEALDNV